MSPEEKHDIADLVLKWLDEEHGKNTDMNESYNGGYNASSRDCARELLKYAKEGRL